MTIPSAPAAPTRETWAEVRAHDRVMRYRRCGAGQAILVLRPADGPEPLWPELARALAANCRVIAPDVPAGADVAAWLSDFLDGLGLARIAVVACDAFCVAALELALLDPDRVAGLVLVADGASDAGGVDGVTATTTERAGAVPLLVVRRGLAVEQALPRVTRFLLADAVTAAG